MHKYIMETFYKIYNNNYNKFYIFKNNIFIAF